jgi:hypothetical protein
VSREFGEYGGGGFFHQKIGSAADDAGQGTWQATKLMEPVLRALYEAAYACASVEERDWSNSSSAQKHWREAMERARAAIDAGLAALTPAPAEVKITNSVSGITTVWGPDDREKVAKQFGETFAAGIYDKPMPPGSIIAVRKEAT